MEDKKEQVEHTCETCANKLYDDPTMMDDECGGCCSWNDKWTPKEK